MFLPGEKQSPDGEGKGVCYPLAFLGLLKKMGINASESFTDKSFKSDFDCTLMGTLLKYGFTNLRTSQLLTSQKKAVKTKCFSTNCSLVCVCCCNGR